MVLMLLGFPMVVASAPGTPASPPAPKQEAVSSVKDNIGDFTYSSEGRRDPFEPLALLKLKRIKDVRADKGYDLSELRLVGVLKAAGVRYALMEDRQGRGINFKKGEFLNSNLWVIDVGQDRVLLGYKFKNQTKQIVLDIPKQ
jgi:Tfp pilus assembly protein PilP